MPKGWKSWHTKWKYCWQQSCLSWDTTSVPEVPAGGSMEGLEVHGGTPFNVLWRDSSSTEGLRLMFHGRTPTQNFCPSCMLGPTTYPDLRNNFVTRRRKVWQFNCHLRKLKIYNKLSFSTPPTAVNPGTTIIAIFLFNFTVAVKHKDFYRTKVNLGSDLWVRMSVRPSDTFLRLNWCDSGWWGYQLNTNW